MSDTYVYEPDAGTRIDDAARAALSAGDPGDTLEFVFNNTRVKYVVPDEDADLKDHVKALLAVYDWERAREDREAPPRLGDIVVWGDIEPRPGDRLVEHIVVRVLSGGVVMLMPLTWDATPIQTRPEPLRVVRRASYRTVGE